MSESAYLDVSAAELARKIRRKDLSIPEVVEHHIARIEEVNPLLNAVVAERFDLARQEAKLAERDLMAASDVNTLPALLGVPCTVKEFWAVQGMPQTGGLVHRKDHISQFDAELVARVRRAGAIVLGVTNVPEGGMWIECSNRLYGRTSNPWDLSRTSGGSSGGDGAIVSSGGVPFAIASDLGGSIRLPAAFCGAVGHKPTGGLVPSTNHFPGVPAEMSNYLTGGPIARRVEDLDMILQIISQESRTCSADLREAQILDPSLLRVYVATSNGRQRVSLPVQKGIEQCAQAFREAGAQVIEFADPRLRRSFEIWSAMMIEVQGASYAEVLGDGQGIELWREALKLVVGRSEHTAPAIGIAAVDQVFRMLPKRDAFLKNLVEEGRALQRDIENVLGDNGLLLYPPYTRTAPPHNLSFLNPLDAAYTAILNVLEFPATVVPVGQDDDGLPIAVQLIGKRGQDRLCLAGAAHLEAMFGGWRRVTPVATSSRDSMIERLKAARK